MSDKLKLIEKYESMAVIPKNIDEITYTRAYALLKIYKEVLWSLEESIEELDRQSRDLLGEDLNFAVEILDKFDFRMYKDKLDDDLYDKVDLKNLLMLIARALIKVKHFPKTGERYFSILEKSFILKYTYTENEMLEFFEISKTTLYKYKKEAIKLFGYCLWNKILPQENTKLMQKVI